MKKLKDNIFFKIIVCLIVTIIMGVIIFFVYQHYDELAKNNSSNNSKNNETEEKEETNDTNKEEEKKEDVIKSFNEFNNKKTNIKINDKTYVLNIEHTDAGNMLTFDDYAITDILTNTKVYYLVLDDVLVVKSSYNSKDSLWIISTDKYILKNYKEDYINEQSYYIENPIIDIDYKDSIYVKNNNIYITYVIDNLTDELNENTIVQYTTVITYDDGSLVDEDNIVSKYTYKDYLDI